MQILIKGATSILKIYTYTGWSGNKLPNSKDSKMRSNRSNENKFELQTIQVLRLKIEKQKLKMQILRIGDAVNT